MLYTINKEFHIAFYEGLNQIGSFQGDEFLEDEVDRFLTRGQNSVIEEMYSVFYNRDEKYLNDLEKIIVKDKNIVPYKLVSTEDNYESLASDYQIFYFNKPYNCKYLLNIKPLVKSINNCSTDTSVIDTEVNEYVAVVPFNTALFTDADYPVTCTITYDLGGTPNVIFNSSSYNLPDINSEDEKYDLIHLILEELNRKNPDLSGNTITVNPANQYNYLNSLGISVYWERYNNWFEPNSFIFVSSIVGSLNKFIEVKIDSTSATAYNATDTNLTYYLIAGEKARGKFYETSYTSSTYTTPITTVTGVCRQIDEKKLYENIISNPLNQPKKNRPLSTQSNNYVYMYLPLNSKTNVVYLDYIRQPRPFNSMLQWTTELSSNLHQNIVNRAVELAMTSIGDAKLQSKVQIDTLER